MPWFSVRAGRFRMSPWGGSARVGRVRVGTRWPWRNTRGSREPSVLDVASDLAASAQQRRLEKEAAGYQAALDDLNDADLPMDERVQVARKNVPQDEIEAIEALSDDEAQTEMGREALQLKRSDPSAYQQLLASFPPEDRQQVLDAVARAEGTTRGAA